MKKTSKIKYMTIGLLLGFILTYATPIMANTINEFILKKSTAKLVVDNQELKNDKLPLLNYNGYNYMPAATFRDIAQKLGIGFEYVQSTNEIKIDTTKKEGINLNDVELSNLTNNEFNQIEYEEFKSLWENSKNSYIKELNNEIYAFYLKDKYYSVEEVCNIIKKYNNYNDYFIKMVLEIINETKGNHDIQMKELNIVFRASNFEGFDGLIASISIDKITLKKIENDNKQIYRMNYFVDQLKISNQVQ